MNQHYQMSQYCVMAHNLTDLPVVPYMIVV